MKLGRIAIAMAVLAAAGIACSTFSSEDPSPITQSEAGDAGTQTEGGSADAGPDVPFCDTVDAQLCWSFEGDEPMLYGPKLTLQSTDGTPPVLVDSGLSAPNAMLVTLRPTTLVQGLRFGIGQDVTYVRCDLDVIFDSIESPDGGGVVAFMQLDYEGSFFNLPFLKATKMDSTTVHTTVHFPTPNVAPTDVGNVPVGQWVHAFLDSERIDGKWIVHAAAGGNAAQLDAGTWTNPRFSKIFFGLASVDKVDWKARMDNLTCSWR